MQERILEMLLNTKEYISGQAISEELGVSRQAIWKAIKSLKSRGFEIESVQNKGYKLVCVPKNLDSAVISARLKTQIIGKNLEVLNRIPSTNDYLKCLGDEGCENGTVVATREQYSGKGRLGRVWESKRDENIAFSILLRPKMKPNEVSSVTPLAGLAVCEALRKITGLDCKIKWPNDIVVGSKKLVGILTEMSAEMYAVSYIVIGIGINVDQKDFPTEIARKATSIFNETGKQFDKNLLLAEIINQIEKEFISENLELSGNALEAYTALCVSVGRQVTFERNSVKLSGEAVGISQSGELEVMLPDGTIYNVSSGEVTVQGIY